MTAFVNYEGKGFSLAGLLADISCYSPVAEKKFPLISGWVKNFATAESGTVRTFVTSTRVGREVIKKGSISNATLWLCASVDHSSGASGFGLRRLVIVACSVSATRSFSAIFRPLYNGFHRPHKLLEFKRAPSSRKRIGLSGEDPSNSSSTGLSSSGSLMDHASCSSDFGLRRWRRFTSPRIEVTIKPALLSPSSFNNSISDTTSCGTLTVNSCDFAFLLGVAITDSSLFWCVSVYAKKSYPQCLKCVSLKCSFKSDGETHLSNAKPGSGGTLTGLLTTTDNRTIEAAMKNSTTHPQGRDSHTLNKFIWRFLALSTANPRLITIEAATEAEARQQSPDGCVMVFSARFRAGVSHA
ncbi:host cell division inhibitor Icd-like protein [Enterobacter asburiae]|nr:host cell division inhibitor Icd-like protein [Enterobacter asburiae]